MLNCQPSSKPHSTPIGSRNPSICAWDRGRKNFLFPALTPSKPSPPFRSPGGPTFSEKVLLSVRYTLEKGTRFSYGYPHLILDFKLASFEMKISLKCLEYIINLRQESFQQGYHCKRRKGSRVQTRGSANRALSGEWKYEQGS